MSVGDGLVSQIPALIVSLVADLLVSKGGTRGRAESAVLGQLGLYPRALFVASVLMGILAIVPGLPVIPFALLGSLMAFVAYTVPKRLAEKKTQEEQAAKAAEIKKKAESRDSVKELLKSVEI